MKKKKKRAKKTELSDLMIPYQEWHSQLQSLYDSQIFHNWALCQDVHLNDEKDGLLLRLIPTRQLQKNTERIENKLLNHIELYLTYSKVYNEPLLLLRIWEEKSIDGIPMTKLMLPTDIESLLDVQGKFQLGLDTIINLEGSVWYSFHPCDTSCIVGDQAEFMSTYLRRWVSIFIFSWLGYEDS